MRYAEIKEKYCKNCSLDRIGEYSISELNDCSTHFVGLVGNLEDVTITEKYKIKR